MSNLTKTKFNFDQMPIAYFCDNKKSNQLRTDLIKNQVRISECQQGDLENTFFSDENIQLLNKYLILAVWQKSNRRYRITEQSKESFIIVMRYVFLESARHLPYDIKGQINDLNNKVISEILPSVYSNVEQRLSYLKEISNPRLPPPLPLNTKSFNRVLPSIDSTFNTLQKDYK